MIIGVQDIYYNVRDMDKAVDFYTTVLGMKLKHKDQWWSALDCGGVRGLVLGAQMIDTHCPSGKQREGETDAQPFGDGVCE